MKIAYDSQIFCAQTYGGVSRYFCEIASRISSQVGAQVSVVAPMSVNQYLPEIPQSLVHGFRAPKTKHFHRTRRVLGILAGDVMLRSVAPDLIHETYFFPYRLGPKKPRRVITIHDMIHEKFPASFPTADRTAGYKARAAARADHVICVSESTRRDVLEILDIDPGKITVIHHGFDLMTAVERGEASRSVLAPLQTPYLLYVGHRGGYKNFSGLLQAYASSKFLTSNFKLICFGGSLFDAQELHAIQSLGLKNGQVVLLEGGDDVLSRLYCAASAFIYPSLYEGFGIPPLEAMAHDCPVICSSTSSIPEVVGNAAEYFDPVDIDSIRCAIEKVLGSEVLRKTLVMKGRERLSRFSWDRCATETYEIYEKLI